MAQTKPIPVRLDEALIARLKKSADRMGSNSSALIKFLVKTFLDHFESRGGVASLPPNWEEIMRHQDGRAFGQLPKTQTVTGVKTKGNVTIKQ